MHSMPTVPMHRPPPGQGGVRHGGAGGVSQFSYLGGLDGLRAIAVIAVMVYHANQGAWLPGGFLGVEVFFVISGYLITLLLIAEHERNGRIKFGQFWMRRARRLLPALFVMMSLLVVYTAFFERDTLGKLRGDVLAGTFYVSNWYQIWTGAGYADMADFAPLRHLWSLAVEEQFYLLWPLVIALALRLKGRRIAELSRWLVLGAIVLTVVSGVLVHKGSIETPAVTPDAFWTVGDRSISKADALYFNTFTRLSGLLLGSAMAMVWRPRALARGAVRTKGPLVDLVGLVGLLTLGLLAWYLHYISVNNVDPWLFRGGFLATGVATLFVTAAVTHPGALTGRLLGNPLLRWIGTRSYGLYLFHWPIYRIIQLRAGDLTAMTVGQLVVALAITVVVTEASYRMVEMPIRTGAARRWVGRLRSQRDPNPRRIIAAGTAVCVGFVAFAGVNLATAELKPNEVEQSLADAEDDIISIPIGSTAPQGTTTGGTDESVVVPASSTSPPTTGPGGSNPPRTTFPPGTEPPTTGTVTTDPPASGTSTTPGTSQPSSTGRYPRLAIGDSVMLGAADALGAYGFDVTADVSRSFDTGTAIAETAKQRGWLGDVVVIHLGANQDPLEQGDLDRMMTALEDVPQVVFVTNRLDRGYIYGQNALFRELPSQYSNVEVFDWAEIGNRCPGVCFYDDNLHLAPDGKEFYASQIAELLGLV